MNVTPFLDIGVYVLILYSPELYSLIDFIISSIVFPENVWLTLGWQSNIKAAWTSSSAIIIYSASSDE